MLALSRRVGEQIIVNGPCVITLVEMKRGSVRIGIEAEPSVSIARAELLDCDGKPRAKITKGSE